MKTVPDDFALTIYKYELLPATILHLPPSATILTIDTQNNGIFIWAMVDPRETTLNTFTGYIAVGTGWSLGTNFRTNKFLKTVYTSNGNFVWHIFQSIC